MICRWIYTCVSPYLKNGYTQVEKNGLQSNDINHNNNLESDNKHQ